MKQNIIFLTGLMTLAWTTLASGVVSDVTARQRYPWNGLVDITVTIQGAEDDVAAVQCLFVATNSATKMEIPVTHVVSDGDVVGSGSTWTRKFIWDAKADVGTVKIDDVTLKVDVKNLGGVQLWEDGPYWAECNVGATKPEEYGYYFWWGDTVGYKRNANDNGWISVKDSTSFSFNSDNCQTYGKGNSQLQSAGYIDETGNLVAMHDAATAHLGAPWRMPTEAEFSALINNCILTWTTRNGVAGRLVTGKDAYATKSIFLPAAGFGDGSTLDRLGSCGYYWPSTPSFSSEYARYFYFYSIKFYLGLNNYRNFGQSVRPVRRFTNNNILTDGGWTTRLSLDCRGAKVVDNTHPLVYDATWYAGGVMAKITADGHEIISGTAGTYALTPVIDGVNLLTLNVYNDSHGIVGTEQVFCLSREGLTDLVIPEGTTEIGDYAFAGGQFTTVTIPNSVTNIATTAFKGCSNIVEVSLSLGLQTINLSNLFPDSVSEIERASVGSRDGTIHANFLVGCESLKNLVIADDVKRIEAGSFDDCTALESVVFPSELEDFGLDLIPESMRKSMGLSYDADGFMIWNGWLLDYDDDYAEEMTVPEGVMGIGHWALADLYDLERVRLPSSLKYITSGAFARDSYLDEAEIPDSVVRIGNEAFEDCSWMQSISVGRGVECVGARAFAGCTKLARIRFEDGLVEIGDCAFSNCWRMMSASLPLSVAKVATTAFKDCSSLTGVNVPTGIAPLSKWFAPVYGQIKDVTIPSGETLVCSNMFKGCSALVSVNIPEGVTNIGDNAFMDCVNLPSVELPSSLQSVGESAFRNCDALTAVGLPDAVRSVGTYAFSDCYRLKDVSLSKNLESLQDRVFDACPQLDSIYVPASVTQLGSRIFGGAMSAVYFIGNAPVYEAGVYASTGNGLVTYVKYGTKGWDGRPNSRDLPQKWPTDNSYGRSILTWDPVQFDVTFDAGEGVFYPVEAQTYACEQVMYTAYSLPPFNPVRKGYKFAGWWTEAVGGTEVTPSTGVTSDRPHTLYAHWSESFIVTVRFNACGGTVSPNEIEYTAEVPFGTLPVPTREHYIFTGWYTAASGGSIVRVSTEVPKADRELFAHWSPAHYEIRFNANNGTGATATQGFIYGQDVTLRANGFSCSGCKFAGWSLTPGGEAVYADGKTISGLAAIEDGVIDLYAVWSGNVYAVRFDSHGGLGVMPNQTFVLGVSQKLSHCTFTRSGFVFKGWALSTTAEVSYGDGEEVCNLTASKNATVVLFAVWERDPHGEWTVAEYLNCTNLTFTLGGDTPLWYGEKVARADKVGMMRSGVIGDSQANWIETVVSGAGQISFWWKANGEYEVSKKGVITRYDYAEFTIDGVSVEEIGDESDWTYVTIPVEGAGSHVLRWMYHKDESGSDGDDCAWLSEVSWVPTQVLEPIPELPEKPTAEDVQSALAGSADSALLVHVTDAATYNAYREWALKIGPAEVKSSPNAWVSFAVDSAALLEKVPTDEDLTIEEFKPTAAAGAFEFTVSVKDVTIGSDAAAENLKTIFGLEGTPSLGSAAFDPKNVTIEFDEPKDGKLKFMAKPNTGDSQALPASFFMKMKVR